MKKMLALLLALSMLLSVMVSCGNNGEEENTDTTESIEETSTVVEPVEPLTLVENGSAKVKIVYPEEYTSTEKNVASMIATTIKNTTGVSSVESGDDFIPKNESYKEGAVEILVGQTAHAECAEAFEKIGMGDYIVKVVGSRLVVAAYCDEALNDAFLLVKQLFEDGVTGEGENKTLSVPGDYEATATSDTMLATIPAYPGGKIISVTDMGDSSQLIVINETVEKEVEAYMAAFASTDYVKKEEHDFVNDTNRYSMYMNDTYMATFFYSEYYEELRIILDVRSETGYDEYLETANQTEKVCEPLLFFVGNNNPASSTENSLCVIVRLANGEFIVFDGGWNESSSTSASDQAATRIRKIMKDNAIDPSNITVAAWVATHPHTDHIGALEYYIDNYLSDKSITIKNILLNFPSEEQIFEVYGEARVEEMTTKINKYRTVFQKAENAGVLVHKTHAGQVFTFGDATLEILFTWDLLAPVKLTDFNGLSIVSRLTVAGQSLMVTGDTIKAPNIKMEKIYASDMHADFYTVAHHGWGLNSNTFVSTIKPLWVLWPAPDAVYTQSSTKPFHEFFWSPSTSLRAEPFVAGFRTYTFQLPFDGSNYTVTNNSS